MRAATLGLALAGLCVTLSAQQGTVRPRDGDTLLREVRRPDGTTRVLAGRIRPRGSSLPERMSDFVLRYGDHFGGDDRSTLGTPETRVETRGGESVRMKQTVRGFELVGHGLRLSLDDDGNVLRAQGVLRPRTERVRAPSIDEDEAEETARERLELDHGSLRGSPTTRPIARVNAGGGVTLLHRVEIMDGRIPRVVEVNAANGEVAAVYEHTSHGQAKAKKANMMFDGESHAFSTTQGRGKVYKKLKMAMSGQEGSSGLPGLTAEDIVPLVADNGTLTGRYAQVVNHDGWQVVDTTRRFEFLDSSAAPMGPLIEAQWFDHANTYYWLHRMGTYFSKLLGEGFAGDTTVLAYVNYDDEGEGYANAFYSPTDSDGPGGYDPGYFLFGELNTGDPMDDLSRDPSIVCHEYTHMVVDRQGATFGDADLDTPPRAVNEALADFAAASFLKDDRIGPAFMAHAADAIGLPGVEALRQLDGERTLQDDLWESVGVGTGLPQEHQAGLIFGQALWEARANLKKGFDALVFESLGGWPLSTAEVGFPVVDELNIADAYEAFFFACFEGMADAVLAEPDKKTPIVEGRLLGAFLGRGITGQTPATVYTVDASGETGHRMNFKARFLGSLDEHVFDLTLAEGQEFSVAIKGAKGTQVSFEFDADAGSGDTPGDFTYGKDRVDSPSGTKSSQAKVLVNTTKTYRLTLSNPDQLGGEYRFSLRVK